MSAFVLTSALVGKVLGQSPKPAVGTPSVVRQNAKPSAQTFLPALVESGQAAFLQNCAFCHGRDAGGGETGPDLTRSKIVANDINGDKIAVVIKNGRPEKGMPRFSLPDEQVDGLVAFIHTQKVQAESQVGGRRGVDEEDVQSGNAKAGKDYFQGLGGCSNCHSASGDLHGVATRYTGLKLEQRFLYPEGANADVTITLPSGEKLNGKLVYRDEFTVGLKDSSGWYHSWPIEQVKYTVNAPSEAHAELLAKYTDDDIHNVMAYLQTLR